MHGSLNIQVYGSLTIQVYSIILEILHSRLQLAAIACGIQNIEGLDVEVLEPDGPQA